ncbi:MULTISPECIES: F0F1 ATP synthase subunit delta [unclassified Bartonella]|uniref:F0F1 ATP synthase subunit delta n=1 Tax=unclassified Bartonella TaxID=2645622 RepID=UPI0021C80EEA|nr:MULTISPECIES: F0F1 ATP synthase subunit delta [unclassified Bartonella]UXN03047.1 F0F1 ATP synthase subunit delta [Bartonella sp. HY406]UXN06009.1 F0F1 ATP synthase subunit delta [Bartonella sp. HY761]
MTETSSLISSVAQRYAGSLFDLASEANCVEAVEKELSSFAQVIAKNDDLQSLIESPVFSAEQQLAAIDSIANKAGLNGAGPKGLTGNFLRVIADHRRLNKLPEIIKGFHILAARARGEVSAEVISALALTDVQEKELKAALSQVVGKDVALNVTVDPAILGGLVVRVGSRQIDTSLRTKLSSLKLALKEVG